MNIQFANTNVQLIQMSRCPRPVLRDQELTIALICARVLYCMAS